MMATRTCFRCKLATYGLVGVLMTFLFGASFRLNYQWELTREHVRFRRGFPSQANWISSPYGALKSYFFNVTNAEAFLNGTDARIKVAEVGPIVYRITGRNEILDQTDSSLTYRKVRYADKVFDAEASCSPDILNRTIVLPNLILLAVAAKLHDWVFLVRHAFNAVTINESVFLSNTVHHFLWEFSTPALDLLSNYVPNIVANCGMLTNAVRSKEEVYNVNIGLRDGVHNFFRVNLLNNKTYFPQHAMHLKRAESDDDYCPITVENSFDNSLFPPFLSLDRELKIVAMESCRTLKLQYRRTVQHSGFKGFHYAIGEAASKDSGCLDNSMGIKLPRGIFDATRCLSNDVPTAFSAPHFYGTAYNWSEHFEGFEPSAEKHEAHLILEPITGIPVEERYRFQSNIPMPDMTGYNKDLKRFSNMMVPCFWYEYDLDDLPLIVLFLMSLNVYVVPVLQPVLMGVFACTAAFCFLKLHLLWTNKSFGEMFRRSASETDFSNK